MPALALCGVGLGLSVPVLSDAALDPDAGLARSGTFTIGVRHLGLVLALASIAPLLASNLPSAGHRATLRATAVLLDAPMGLTTKIPVALDLRSAFERARDGQIPDLAEPFNAHGARDDPKEETITRSFRSAFLVSAAFAAAALGVAFLFRRRLLT